MRSDVLIASGEPWSRLSAAEFEAMVAGANARLIVLDRPDRWMEDWHGDGRPDASVLIERLAVGENVAFLVVPTLNDANNDRPRAVWRAELIGADEDAWASRHRLVLSVAPSMRPHFRRDIRRGQDGVLVGHDRPSSRTVTVPLAR